MHKPFEKGDGVYLKERGKSEYPGEDGDNIKPTLHKQKRNIYSESYAIL
jgi:hypothetical protein